MPHPDASSLLRAYETSGQGWFWATDAAGVISYITPQVAAQLSAEPERLVGMPLQDVVSVGEHASGPGRTLPFLLTKRARFENLVVKSTRTGAGPLWALAGAPQFAADGSFNGYCGSAVDITEQLQSSEHAARLAMYDSLTGLPNRLRMADVLAADLNAVAAHKRPCAVMMLDLDRFKQVNDTLGHPAGDELLKQVADRLFRIVGDRECIFRLGGDEFQVIVREFAGRDALHELGEQIIAMLSQPYAILGSRCIIGASIGIAISPENGRDGDQLIRNADLALYDAKGRGRGCVSFFSTDLLKEAEDKRVLEDDLREALGRGEIQVYYQPFVNTTTNTVTGVEALLRWNHPERGFISPDVFIPIAEEANLIAQLGEWTLRRACDDAVSWPGKLRVAINVSPTQFSAGSLPAIVTSALASSGLSPERLELEITEGVFLSESAATDGIFATLKQIGVRLSLDDFGTGYSSLGYLRTAPFDKIKIDRTFVRAATLPGSRNAAIIAAIVALAEALGMETTAEGIETLDQLELIRNLRVSHVQGYLYSQAIACDALQENLGAGEWSIAPSGPSRQRSERISMFRKVRAIFGNYARQVLIRNLSETGALVEGLDDVPYDSQLIIDFGEGNLVFARVNRSRNRQQGVAFEEALIFEGQGVFRTPHQVSSYTLAKAGLSSVADQLPSASTDDKNAEALKALRVKLGIPPCRSIPPTEMPPARVCEEIAGIGTGITSTQPSRDLHERPLSIEELQRLIEAAEASSNPQLKFIVQLLIGTHARQRDLLEARWTDFNLQRRLWTIPSHDAGNERHVPLSEEAVNVLRELPRWDDCPFVLANPITKIPYRSFAASWHTARMKAGLPDVEIDDLRFCSLGEDLQPCTSDRTRRIARSFARLR